MARHKTPHRQALDAANRLKADARAAHIKTLDPALELKANAASKLTTRGERKARS
jgi:hypothetical protein